MLLLWLLPDFSPVAVMREWEQKRPKRKRKARSHRATASQCHFQPHVLIPLNSVPPHLTRKPFCCILATPFCSLNFLALTFSRHVCPQLQESPSAAQSWERFCFLWLLGNPPLLLLRFFQMRAAVFLASSIEILNIISNQNIVIRVARVCGAIFQISYIINRLWALWTQPPPWWRCSHHTVQVQMQPLSAYISQDPQSHVTQLLVTLSVQGRVMLDKSFILGYATALLFSVCVPEIFASSTGPQANWNTQYNTSLCRKTHNLHPHLSLMAFSTLLASISESLLPTVLHIALDPAFVTWLLQRFYKFGYLKGLTRLHRAFFCVAI